LQFSLRRPKSKQPYYAGDPDIVDEVTEPSPEAVAELQRLLTSWQAPDFALNQIAVLLQLPRTSLQAIGVGYNRRENCWIFPERDDRGRLVGLLRRFPDGRKWAIEGCKRGLTIPRYLKPLPSGPPM